MTTPRSFFRLAGSLAALTCLLLLAFSGTSDFADKGTACTTESVGNFDDGGFITATPTLAVTNVQQHVTIANDESAWNSQTESGANEGFLNGVAFKQTDQTHAVFAVMHFKPTAASARAVHHTWSATDDTGANSTSCVVTTQTDQTGRYLFDQTAGFQSNIPSCAISSSGDFSGGAMSANYNPSGSYDGASAALSHFAVLLNCNPSIIGATPGDIGDFNFQRAG